MEAAVKLEAKVKLEAGLKVDVVVKIDSNKIDSGRWWWLLEGPVSVVVVDESHVGGGFGRFVSLSLL
eukprot:365159-Chlamydomonas_euryale.AAC.8